MTLLCTQHHLYTRCTCIAPEPVVPEGHALIDGEVVKIRRVTNLVANHREVHRDGETWCEFDNVIAYVIAAGDGAT